MKSTTIALGYKDGSGHIIVTDVLCTNFPEMTKKQLGDLSWNLTQWATRLRQKEAQATSDERLRKLRQRHER